MQLISNLIFSLGVAFVFTTKSKIGLGIGVLLISIGLLTDKKVINWFKKIADSI